MKRPNPAVPAIGAALITIGTVLGRGVGSLVLAVGLAVNTVWLVRWLRWHREVNR